jgi:hypothetical protein
MSRPVLLLTLLALVAGCEKRGPSAEETRANAAQALRNVLAYPVSSLVSVSSGSEAAEMVLTSPYPMDSVAAWYRIALPLNKWTIKTDTKDREGKRTIYAERDARPLWITMQDNVGAAGTTYRLVGVFNIDSTKADTAAAK